MLTQGTLARAIKQNDWFTSVDLKDAFFHIGIYPPHRKYLRFAYQGICYEFTVLLFGSPNVLSVCGGGRGAPETIRAENSDLHRRLAHHSQIEGEGVAGHRPGARAHHIPRVLGECEQNNLTPSQDVIFLGLDLNSVSMRVRSLSNGLSVAVQRGGKSAISHMSQAAGSHGFIYPSCAVGLLRMRAFTKWVLSLHFSPIRDLCRLVTVTRACSAALRHWESENFYARGTPLGTVTMRKVVTTDASLTGWGTTQAGRTMNGLWLSRLRSAHMNYLELLPIGKL